MKYGKIDFGSVANGPGVRVAVFVSGCRRHCPGCFNRESQDFDYGKEFTSETKLEILNALSRNYVQGLTVLGGEPFEPENLESVFELIEAVRVVFGKQKDIWIYSGFTFEELWGDRTRWNWKSEEEYKRRLILNSCDVLVDGPFVEEQKDLMLQFRGSSNQRIINLKEYRRK